MTTSRERKLEISFAVLVQSATWSVIASLPAKSVQLSPWRDGWDWYDRWITTPRPYWDRQTSSSSSSGSMFWLIFLGFFLFVLLVLLLRYLCKCDDSSTEESSATLHPPPARIVPPPNRSTQSFGSQNTRNSNPFATGIIYNISTHNSTGISNTYNAGDRPPGYFVVVTDLGEGKTKFPEVSPKPPETPPPKYEDGSLPRY